MNHNHTQWGQDISVQPSTMSCKAEDIWRRVLTHPAIRALQRLCLIIQTSLLGSYMPKSA